ncbi:MAG TPA: chitobiase/beta-hexosaminidase C-terminal domain-containing protein, partial [Polyangia bacterium]
MNHEVLSRAPLNRLLLVLLGGVITAGCGDNTNPPPDASRAPDTGSPRDTAVIDSAPRDTAGPPVDTAGPAVDAPSSPDTNRALAATPVFAPAGGIYSDPQAITISSGSVGVQIHYTVDGTEPTAASPVYTAALSVILTTTIKAIAVDPTGTFLNSALASATYTMAARVPPPAFSIPSGTYGSAQLVTVTDSNPNATIRYTVDGSDPTATSAAYTMPISVSTTMTVKAVATLTGMVDSLVSSAKYTIQTLVPAATPTFSPVAGTYAGAQDVTIATTTAGAEIYYSLDGTDPTQSSSRYATPVRIANSTVLKARAYATGMAPSAVASAAYSITAPAAAKPSISPNGGTFTAPQQVTLSTTETGGRIIYTTDGSIPNTTSGNIYSTPFTLAQSATVNAIVVNVTGKDPSPLATAVFTINIALPIAFDKQTGTYNNDLSVAITSSASGAIVCYTKDASDPACSATGTCASGQSTAGVPVVITGNASASGTTVRARACKAGLPAGPVVEQIYTMVAAGVVFAPAGSTVAIGTAVSMSSATSGAEIRYRDDSTDPTCTTGTVYTAAIVLSQSKPFRAIACKANYTASTVSNASYGVKLTTPIALQLDSGNQYVTVAATATTTHSIDDLVFALGASTAAMASQTLCYSVNGTAPACTTGGACNTSVAGLFSRTLQATADPIYGKLSSIVGDSATADTIAAPADASATLAVKAAFCAPNYAISDVSTVTYTFKAATPTLSRATGTTTLASENASNTIATTTTGARLRYYKIDSGATPPALSCAGAVPNGVTEVNGITTTIQV